MSSKLYYDNIIIGAGPAGIQLGYFFKKLGIEYIILERNELVGSFFDKYPHSGKLISINKKYTGNTHQDFNLRHDWNSLLSDENLLFTEYSDDYYPDKKDLVKYLNDYATKNELNILYKTYVKEVIKKEGTGYILNVIKEGEEITYECDSLICATGLSKPMIPVNTEIKTAIKHYSEYEKDYFLNKDNLKNFINKSILIIGNGNAGYELANLLNNYASRILIYGKKPKPWAMTTHYTGDLRSVYIPYYDTFLLKSLNSLENNSVLRIKQESEGSKYIIYKLCSEECKLHHPYFSNDINKFDVVIYTTGWKFDNSIFNFDLQLTENKKYPQIKSNYESVNNKNLYFIGSLMHSLDFKKSSGGFIHGFRYLIKYFVNLNYDNKFELILFDSNKLEEIVNHIVYKINMTSPMYQMYGQLCDLICYNKETKQVYYYNNVSVRFLYEDIFKNREDTIFIVLTLEYSNEHIYDIDRLGQKESVLGKESDAKLLHPIIRVFEDINGANKKIIDEIHFDEDIIAVFSDTDLYYNKIMRTLKMFIN